MMKVCPHKPIVHWIYFTSKKHLIILIFQTQELTWPALRVLCMLTFTQSWVNNKVLNCSHVVFNFGQKKRSLTKPLTVEWCQVLPFVTMWLPEACGWLQLPSIQRDRENCATKHHPGKGSKINIRFLQNANHFWTITQLKEI